MDRKRVYVSPAGQREQADCPMCRIIRIAPALDQCFQPLERHVHWHHVTYFRLLVVTIAFMWGRRQVANVYRDLEAPSHRTRVHNFCLVERGDPEAVLRQKAQELLRALHPQPRATIYLIIDDSKKATRGQGMEAVATMKDPMADISIQGHPYVGAILVCRDQVIPGGIRLYAKPPHAKAMGRPCRKTTELAAHLIREFKAPAGVKVMVLFDASSLCPTVGPACRAQGFRLASTRNGNRRLFKPSWQLKAGRYGKKVFRRRRTTSLVLPKLHGSVRYRFVDAGWLKVSTLGPLPVVFSRTGSVRKILGLVTEDPERSAAGLIQTYDNRWAVELFFNDSKPLLGLGQSQNRAYGAAVTHLHLVALAYALLTHLRLMRHGAQGRRTQTNAAHWSPAAVQDHLRGLLWDDLVAYLQEKHHGESVLLELERLRVA